MEYAWLKNYEREVPHSLKPYRERTLLDVVSDTARQRPDHTALIFKGRRLSYFELEKLGDAFANALVERGMKRGDRVALILPNSPQSVITQLGVWKAGGIAAPINPLYTEHELKDEMKCGNHPDREAIGVCQKHETGFCQECCECLDIDQCCECMDPKLYCKFRTQCIIWEMSRDRRKKEIG